MDKKKKKDELRALAR
jgi:hypothetical protein